MMVETYIEKLIDDTFSLNDKQRTAALERERDVVVTAGAGSGKTLTLVARYTTLLAEGISPRRIAAITFTKKAAREMRSRVRTKLMKLQQTATDPDEQHKWTELSAKMDSARIGTIHSLCAEILRAHPAECGIDPRFQVLDEGLSAALRQQAVNDTLKLLADDQKFSPLLYNIDVRDLITMLGDLLNNRLEAKEAFKVSIDQQALIIRILTERLNHPSIRDLIDYLTGFSNNALLEDAGDTLAGQITDFLESWGSAVAFLSEEGFISCAETLYEIRRSKMNLHSGKRDSVVKSAFAELRDHFDALINPITGGKDSKDPMPYLESQTLAEDLLPLLREAFEKVKQVYQDLLDQRQALDFDDLEGRTVQLFDRQDIRERWQREMDALLIDEFQDTNQRQRKIIEALTDSPGKLFIVGDMRQSIYRFRQADVTVFSEVQKQIRDHGGLIIDLDLTYRAHQPLLTGIGDLLSVAIGTQPDPDRPYYVPFTPMTAFQEIPPEGIQVPHIEFILGASENSEQAQIMAAHALARRLIDLKAEGQIDQWDDVALLFRASTGFSDYEEALQEAGIPYVTIAGRGFYDRPEIRDLLNILRALADPQDDLAFAGLLRSPAFGLSDGALYDLRQAGQTYYQAINGDLSSLNKKDQLKLQRTSQILAALLPLVDRIPVAELIKEIVDAVDYRAILASAGTLQDGRNVSGAGGRLYRNLDKLLEDALMSQQVSIRGFLDMLQTLNDAGAREGEAPAEAEGAVRLMTIHKAKGLEFNVVVLAAAGRRTRSSSELAYLDKDLGVALKLDPPSMLYQLAKHNDKDQDAAEELRLIYVALTRAKNKLIISSHTTPNNKGELTLSAWAKDLAEAAELDMVEVQNADGNGTEGKTSSGESFSTWCAFTYFNELNSYLPRVETEQNGDDNRIPLYLPLDNEEKRNDEIKTGHTLDTTQLRATGSEGYAPGATVGTLVHKAIQHWIFPGNSNLIPLLQTAALEAGLINGKARMKVIDRSIELLNRLKEHPLWNEISNSTENYHELPFTIMAAGKPQSGVVDLLFKNSEGWHIVDFKTDSIQSDDLKEKLIREYTLQVERYLNAIKVLSKIDLDASICFLDDHGNITQEKSNSCVFR